MIILKNRIKWIDIAKGIGILLVALGHAYIPEKWAIVIFSFHVPLFFFLSGYLFSTNKYKSLKDFGKSRIKSLLIPYFIFSLLSYSYMFLITVLGLVQVDLSRSFIGIFYSNASDGWMNYNMPLWFLTCLFVVEMMFYSITTKFKTINKLIMILITFSVIGYLGSLYMPFKLPWGFNIALTAIVFYGIGYIFKVKNFSVIIFKYKFYFLIGALIGNFIFVYDMIQKNYKIDMNLNELNQYFNFYIPAICGILIIIIVSSFIKESKILTYFGKNTLIILAIHGPIINILSKIFEYLGWIDLTALRSFILTLVTVSLIIPIIEIINRFLPFLLGKKRV